jgi:DNA-binding transcriptional MerR regulator
MAYSSGDVSQMTGIPVSTLRFYDKEGLFPDIERGSGGTRKFTDTHLASIHVVECLKNSGLTIKEIRQFLDWCQEGDNSLTQRQQFFHERLAAVEEQLAVLQQTLDLIRYKCWYYDTAVAAGTERAPRNTPIDEIPESVRQVRLDEANPASRTACQRKKATGVPA